MKQLIIARKDLHMSPGKLAAQVSHASMASLSKWIVNHMKNNVVVGYLDNWTSDWLQGSFTKIICEAKNKNQLLKVKNIANSLGLEENEDFYLIKDNCLTELKLEEVDENGVGRTLTCIGFRPMPDNIVTEISKKYQLYR